MRFLVTGTAGFIGFHLAGRLLNAGHQVAGVDGLTPYYDIGLKQSRHRELRLHNAFECHEFHIEDEPKLIELSDRYNPDVIIHLAAQAGVRYSLENPKAYVDANLNGTFQVLEAARILRPKHLLIASTSSVYGANRTMPFRECDTSDQPLTLYAATKKACEVMAHSYAHLWSLPTTVTRFFTVYGPWGRPDMALFKFVEAGLSGATIDVYGNGRVSRDFTYIDDLIEAMVRLVDCPPTLAGPVSTADSLSPVAPYRTVNIGAGAPILLGDFIVAVEEAIGTCITKRLLPMQPGDVPATWASSELLESLTGYKPQTPLGVGVAAFVRWYQDYYARSN